VSVDISLRTSASAGLRLEEAAHYRAQLSLLVVEREIHCISRVSPSRASIRYRTN